MAVQYHSNFDGTLNFSDVTPRVSLLQNAAVSYTVPGTAEQNYQVLFDYASSANVYVGYNTAALVPAAGTVQTAGRIEYKPCKRFVKGGDVLSFITPDATAFLGLSLRSLPA